MPIIGNVGRRSFKVRLLNISIHVILILGAVTMVYPFLMMLSGSMKSTVDNTGLTAVPSYFYDEGMLYKKWIEAKYNESVETYSICYRERPSGFIKVEPTPYPVRQRYDDWNEFLRTVDTPTLDLYRSLGFSYGIRIKPEMFRLFIKTLQAEPDVQGDIVKLNDKYRTTFTDWDQIGAPGGDFITRDKSGSRTPMVKRILEFCANQPGEYFEYFSLDSLFVQLSLKPKYGSLEALNSQLKTHYRSWADVRLSRNVPEGLMREDWTYLVRQRLNVWFVHVADEALPDYQAFLQKLYEKIDVLNTRYETNYKDFSEIPILHGMPSQDSSPLITTDWDKFVTGEAKVEHLSVKSLEFMYREFLEKKYGTLEALIENQALGLQQLENLAVTESMPRENIIHAADWVEFARRNIGTDWVGPDSGARRDWANFLTKPFRIEKEVNIDALNAELGTAYENENKISLSLTKPDQPKLAEKWLEFLRDVCPSNLLRIDVTNAVAADEWYKFIGGKYAGVDKVNRAYGLIPDDFDSVDMPVADVDWFSFVKTRKHSFWEFVTRNYAIVFQTILSNGRAAVNTLIYCVLAVFTALLVNPLAAYALSRYKPPSQYKMLLMLMLTMAFPEMVLGIPNFLLLRQLNLLNTFAALVLPGMANGYMIFILKGFLIRCLVNSMKALR